MTTKVQLEPLSPSCGCHCPDAFHLATALGTWLWLFGELEAGQQSMTRCLHNSMTCIAGQRHDPGAHWLAAGKYLKREVLNLARFISTMKTRPLTWRLVHPYVVADRLEVRGGAHQDCPHCAALTAFVRGASGRGEDCGCQGGFCCLGV
jgi:hypothetical protein